MVFKYFFGYRKNHCCSVTAAVQPSRTYGLGMGTVLLDDISCVGNESSLFNCRHRAVGTSDCSHREDVGVKCLTGRAYGYSPRVAGGWEDERSWVLPQWCYRFSKASGLFSICLQKQNNPICLVKKTSPYYGHVEKWNGDSCRCACSKPVVENWIVELKIRHLNETSPQSGDSLL